MDYTKNILIVDGYNLFIRSYFSNYAKNSYSHLGTIFIFLKSILYKLQKFNIPYYNVLIYFDRGAKTHKSISNTYKSNRASFYRSLQKTDFRIKLDRLKEYLELLKFNIIEIPGVEVDLLIGYSISNLSKIISPGCQIYIMSNDNDFWQLLVFPQINIISKGDEVINTHNYDRYIKYFKYCPPASYPLYKALKGDVSDNIKGLEGIGDKTLEKLFYNLWLHNRFVYTIDDLISFLKLPEVSFPKILNAILLNKDKLETNYKLVNILQNDLLTLNAKIQMDYILNSPSKDFTKEDMLKLTKLIKEDGLNSLLSLISILYKYDNKEVKTN